MDCGPPAPLSMGILRARKLEWVAISFSNLQHDIDLSAYVKS